jgi:hypothetical protein
MKFEEIAKEVQKEREYQEKKHKGDLGHNHSLLVWLGIISKYNGKLSDAVIESYIGEVFSGDDNYFEIDFDKIKHRLIQIAALCFAALEDINDDTSTN